MSSIYVRKQIEQWAADPAMPVPFYPTINQEQNPTDDIWFTVDFGTSYREVLTFCQGQQLEEGEVEFIFFGPPGTGYDAVLQALETSMDWLMTQLDPNGKMVLTGRSAPFDFSGGSADQQFAVSCYVDYQFYT